jgi:uncharacterized protein DUF1360
MTWLAQWLACYRAVRLLQRDDVPPLPALRDWLMARYGARPASALLDCPWCLSVWVAAALLVLRAACPRLHAALVALLAASAVTGIITEVMDAVTPPE